MLIAIEGPDRVGKTSMFNRLREQLLGPYVFIPSVPFDPQLMPLIDLIEERTVALWRAFHNPDIMYICDRCPFISNVVYADVYGRTPRFYPDMHEHLRMIYIRADPNMLGRPADVIPQDYTKVITAYDKVACMTFGITVTPDDDEYAIDYITELRHAHSLQKTSRMALTPPPKR